MFKFLFARSIFGRLQTIKTSFIYKSRVCVHSPTSRVTEDLRLIGEIDVLRWKLGDGFDGAHYVTVNR